MIAETPTGASTVVIGEFDGFHRGHQELMAAACRLAEGNGNPLVAVILDYAAREQRLQEPAQRANAALSQGATAAHVLAVPDVPIPDATELVVEKVLEATRPTEVVMACSPHLSDSRIWDPSMATSFDERRGPVVQVMRAWSAGGEVSTQEVLRHLHEGDVGAAAQMLGRRPSFGGSVARGAALGRTLGFPTANLIPPEHLVVPAAGVYAAIATHAGGQHMAAVNIGRRPTVESDGTLLVEAHLLDFDGDLYDQHLDLEFHARLRAEQRFDGLDELVAQLGKDVERTRVALRSVSGCGRAGES